MEIVIIAGITTFLGLALFWYITGRFFLIGFLVKILWIPINIFYGLFWIVALLANCLIAFIRNSRLYPFLIFGLIFWIFYSYTENEQSLFHTVPIAIFIFVFFKLGFNEAFLKSAMNYSPKPRKTYIPPPKKTKLQKEYEKEQNKKHLPPPLVEVLVKTRGKFETIEQLKRRIDNQKAGS